MAEREFPNLAIKGGYAPKEKGWGPSMNENLLKLSTLAQASVSARVAAYPGAPADGLAVINTTTQKIAVRDLGAWVEYTPHEGWLVYDQATDEYVKFDGAAWVVLETGGGGGGGGGGIEEAPADGKTYGRKDEDWTEIVSGGGGGGGTSTRKSARYWRLRMTRRAANSGWGGNRFAFRKSGVVISVGGTPISSVPASGVWSAEEGFSGLSGADVGWYSGAENENVFGVGHWIGYDFGLPVAPDAFEMAPLTGFPSMIPPEIAIDYSDDGDVWFPLAIAQMGPSVADTAQSQAIPEAPASATSGGGGGRAIKNFAPPLASDFPDIVLAAGVTLDLVDADAGLAYQVGNVGTGVHLALAMRPVPAGDFFSKARIAFSGKQGNALAGGLAIRNETTGRVMSIAMVYGTTGFPVIEVAAWNSLTSYNGGRVAVGSVSSVLQNLFYKIEQVGTDITFAYSPNGEQWQVAWTEPVATFIGEVDQVGLFSDNETITPIQGLVDWYEDSELEPRYAGLFAGTGADLPVIVQQVHTRAEATAGKVLALPAAPTPGNLLVLIWSGPGGSNKTTPPNIFSANNFALVEGVFHDGGVFGGGLDPRGSPQQGMWIATRRVQPGDSANVSSGSIGADNHNFSLFEVEDADIIGFHPTAMQRLDAGSLHYVAHKRKPAHPALRFLVVEHDGAANITFGAATGVALLSDYAPTGATNHRAAIASVSLDADTDVAVDFSGAAVTPMAAWIFLAKAL